jgi:hypothetical protein
MEERIGKILRLLARWGLNLSIALSVLLLALVAWWAVSACFVYPQYWYKPATEPVNSYPESMEILRQLNGTNAKH